VSEWESPFIATDPDHESRSWVSYPWRMWSLQAEGRIRGASVDRRPSRFTGHGPFALIVVAIVLIASVGTVVYWWSSLQTQSVPPTRYDAFAPIHLASVTTSGNTNGPGGCSGPGPGHTEYCYTFGLAFEPESLLIALDASPASVVYETTADASFVVQATGGGNLPFLNVTLLNATGRILATFNPGNGWTAFAGSALPITLWTNQTCVLNIGLTSASGDGLGFEQGAWGTVVTQLP
jgi:hypothetical protein